MKKLYRFLLNKLPRPLLIRLSYPFKKLAPLIYRGNNVSCPVCVKSYRKFLSYGSEVAHREGVLCPGDLTLERHRLMWLYLRDFSDFFTKSNLKVLHMAPEQCFLDKFKAQKNLDYLTADIVSPIADIHFDLHNIPIEDNRFDIVLQTENGFHYVKVKAKVKSLDLETKLKTNREHKPSIYTEMMDYLKEQKIISRTNAKQLTP